MSDVLTIGTATGMGPVPTKKTTAVPTYNPQLTVPNTTDNYQYSNNTLGGDTGTTEQTEWVNPYSSSQLALLGRLPGALGDIYNSSIDATKGKLPGMRVGLEEYGYGQDKAQRDINTQAIQNEMARKSGTAGVLGMVSKGLQQGGRMLASRNAGNSSGVQSLARIYSKIGAAEMNKVGNQYETGNMNIDNAQKDLFAQQDLYKKRVAADKEQIVADIVEAARVKLDALNEQLIGASLTDRIDIQNEISKVRSGAQSELGVVDAILTDEIKDSRGLKTGQESNRTKAIEMISAGNKIENPFQFRSDVVPTMNQQVPTASSLPIYTLPRRKTQEI